MLSIVVREIVEYTYHFDVNAGSLAVSLAHACRICREV